MPPQRLRILATAGQEQGSVAFLNEWMVVTLVWGDALLDSIRTNEPVEFRTTLIEDTFGLAIFLSRRGTDPLFGCVSRRQIALQSRRPRAGFSLGP